MGRRRTIAAIRRRLASGDLRGLARSVLRRIKRSDETPGPPLDHGRWRARHLQLSEDDHRRLDQWIAVGGPTVEVHLALEGSAQDLVRRTIASVTGQRTNRWRLVLHGDEDATDRVLDDTPEIADDARFSATPPDAHVDRSSWIWPILPGDVLHEAAIGVVSGFAARNPKARIIYVDEDHVDPGGLHHFPHAKPDWNPDLLRGCDYLGRSVAFGPEFSQALVMPSTGTGGRVESSDAAAHERNLAATALVEGAEIVHIPHLLFSRLGTDGPPPIPHRRQINDPLPDPPPRVSILIPTRDRGRMLARCLESLRETSTYPDTELVVIDHETTQRRARRLLVGLTDDPRATVLRHRGPFNFSAMVNRAAAASSGQILCLLNNDTEVLSPDWLETLVGQLCRPGVGAVGALLLFPDDTIQHAGVHPGVGGLMGHGHKHLPADDPGYFGRLTTPHEVAAVTGACLAIKRSLWDELGGLDQENLPVAYNDVDLCLRVRTAGLRIILAPGAVLRHHESVSRGFDDDPIGRQRLAREVELMRNRWGALLDEDPAYNPNLALDGGSFRLTDAPRTIPPWSEQQDQRTASPPDAAR